MINRRYFLKTTSLTALGAVLIPRFANAAAPKFNIGLQLYTVRDQLQQDFMGTLRSLKKIGYTWLEAAGYNDGKFYGLAPAEFKKKIEHLGMKVISSHTLFNPDKQKQSIAAHAELGVEYLIFPGFPVPEHKTKDDFLRAAARLNAVGEACNKAGMKFGYHNHDFEFLELEGSRGFDILLNSTDSQKVIFESDIYWMIYAGVNPQEYFEKYPGRFHLWHVKDMKSGPDKGFTEVGTGTIRYDELFKSKTLAGMKYFFVEQDTCETDSLKSVEISYNNLQTLLQ